MAIRRVQADYAGSPPAAPFPVFDEITRSHAGKVSAAPVVTRPVARNSHGHITTRHKGGGHKRRYRRDRLPS